MRLRKGSLAQRASTTRSTKVLSCTRLLTKARFSSLLISLKRGSGRTCARALSSFPPAVASTTEEDDDGGGCSGCGGGGCGTGAAEPAAHQSEDAWLLCARTDAVDCCSSALRMKTGAAFVLMTCGLATTAGLSLGSGG